MGTTTKTSTKTTGFGANRKTVVTKTVTRTLPYGTTRGPPIRLCPNTNINSFYCFVGMIVFGLALLGAGLAMLLVALDIFGASHHNGNDNNDRYRPIKPNYWGTSVNAFNFYSDDYLNSRDELKRAVAGINGIPMGDDTIVSETFTVSGDLRGSNFPAEGLKYPFGTVNGPFTSFHKEIAVRGYFGGMRAAADGEGDPPTSAVFTLNAGSGVSITPKSFTVELRKDYAYPPDVFRCMTEGGCDVSSVAVATTNNYCAAFETFVPSTDPATFYCNYLDYCDAFCERFEYRRCLGILLEPAATSRLRGEPIYSASLTLDPNVGECFDYSAKYVTGPFYMDVTDHKGPFLDPPAGYEAGSSAVVGVPVAVEDGYYMKVRVRMSNDLRVAAVRAFGTDYANDPSNAPPPDLNPPPPTTTTTTTAAIINPSGEEKDSDGLRIGGIVLIGVGATLVVLGLALFVCAKLKGFTGEAITWENHPAAPVVIVDGACGAEEEGVAMMMRSNVSGGGGGGVSMPYQPQNSVPFPPSARDGEGALTVPASTSEGGALSMGWHRHGGVPSQSHRREGWGDHAPAAVEGALTVGYHPHSVPVATSSANFAFNDRAKDGKADGNGSAASGSEFVSYYR